MCKYCDNLIYSLDNFSIGYLINNPNLSEKFPEYAARFAGLKMEKYGHSPEFLEKKHIEEPKIWTEEKINKFKSHPLYGKIVLEYYGDDEGYVPIDYCPFCGKKLI